MAKRFKNKKDFLIIELDLREVIEVWGKYGGCGVCDECNDIPDKGYFVAVLNQYLCPTCFNKWLKTAKKYQQDSKFEQMVFNHEMAEFVRAGLWEQ